MHLTELNTLPHWKLILQCTLLSILILVIDISIPLGVAAGVPHVIVVLLALQKTDSRFAIGFAFWGSLMTIIGFLYSDPQGVVWMVYTNRALALLTIWVTLILGLKAKRFQKKLKESEDRFQVMADNAPIMIWRTDTEGLWEFISQGWREFTGRTLVQMKGRGWLADLHGQDRNKTESLYDACLAKQQIFETECRIRTRTGEYRWVVLQGTPWTNDANVFSGFIGTALDIHERRLADQHLEETRQKYYHREKMAMIDTLAGGMLHEIGNPTAVISSVVQAVINDCNEGPFDQTHLKRIYKSLQQIQDQVDRISQTNKEIIDFTTLQDDKLELHDVNQLIERICRLIRHDDRMRTIKLTLNLSAAVPAVEIIPDNIVQLVFSLIENSIAACQTAINAEIKVTTGMQDDTLILSVVDNGCGIPAELLNKSTDALYFSHDQKEWSGLGLTLCNTIAEEYGGYIDIKSEEGSGTQVTVILRCIVQC